MDSRSNAVAIPALAVPDCAAVRGSAPRGNVKFARATPDHAMHEMKARVAKYFETRKLSSKANAGMVVKTVLLLAITFVPYGLILTNRFSWWEMLLLAFGMGVGMAGIWIRHRARCAARCVFGEPPGQRAARDVARRPRSEQLHVEDHAQHCAPHVHEH